MQGNDMTENKPLTKVVRKKAENPFEAAGYELVQIRFRVENMVKGFSDKDRKDPNYKQFLKDIKTEIEKAVDHKAREDHANKTKWHKILDFVTLVFNNPLFLAIICIILGALLGNVELLKTIFQFFKG
jgi:hypothetical protein